jgi:hypothetical protein
MFYASPKSNVYYEINEAITTPCVTTDLIISFVKYWEVDDYLTDPNYPVES